MLLQHHISLRKPKGDPFLSHPQRKEKHFQRFRFLWPWHTKTFWLLLACDDLVKMQSVQWHVGPLQYTHTCVCVCIHIYISIHTYVNMCIYTYVRACICVYVYTHMCVYKCISVYRHMCVHICIYTIHIHVHCLTSPIEVFSPLPKLILYPLSCYSTFLASTSMCLPASCLC